MMSFGRHVIMISFLHTNLVKSNTHAILVTFLIFGVKIRGEGNLERQLLSKQSA